MVEKVLGKLKNPEIKFFDPKSINARYRKELIDAAISVIDSGWYINGSCKLKFENDLATYLGINHVTGVGNGLDALSLIFRAYLEKGDIQEGDEVILPSHTFIATALSITNNNLKPIFVDADSFSYNISVDKIEQAITEKTSAILVVHLYGRTSWSDELKMIGDKYNLKIVEDNAQALGAIWNGKRAGTLGDASATSFYPVKNLGALGDGGAVATNDHDLGNMIKALSNYGTREKYYHKYKGINSRLDEMQAALLSVKLKHLDEENKRRRELADHYLKGINNQTITLPHIPTEMEVKNWEGHVWHQFVIRTGSRDELQAYLLEKGISTLVHYPSPVHKQEAFSEFNQITLPETEMLASEVISLPISPDLKEIEIKYIIEKLNQFET